MPDALADCPMAHMVDIDSINSIKNKYEDLAVVCYINSTALIKSHSDVCVTFSNAVKIVKALPQKNIYFIPDRNLGKYVASQVTNKNFIFNDGFCHVHTSISRENVLKAKEYAPFVRKIEVEVENLEMLEEALNAGADIIMLDNMDNETRSLLL